MRNILPAWIRDQLQSPETTTLLNPFNATVDGRPEVFLGRDDVVQQVTRLLDLNNSIALLAPSRCGKTSLLRMLPTLLPDTLCIYFDLKGHPIDTVEGFLQALARETQIQASRRGLELPAFGDGLPFEAAIRWLDGLESSTDRRLLICLDNFETLERSLSGSEIDLIKLMGLFRGTIQNRRRIHLLFCGEAPFDELDAVWNDHLISVRQVRFAHLDPANARDLIRRPIPEFPEDTIPAPVAERIVERTGGQPYLVQLYAQLLVEGLNDAGRSQATVEDLQGVEPKVLKNADYYFRQICERAPETASKVLAALVRDETPEIGRKPRRWLQHRALISETEHLTIPLFASWESSCGHP